ncbi:competence protein CoiA family protein [Aeromonas sp. 3P]|uniref:competence protein CoiA family protein n=1 Tax=Aeromonas sp. 3P TaxID=3452719 RepID=UPI003F798184
MKRYDTNHVSNTRIHCSWIWPCNKTHGIIETSFTRRSVPMPVKMSRAFDASKGIVSIEDVPSGKACGCTCIDCNEPLVAKKGEVNRHHFAHEPVIPPKN